MLLQTNFKDQDKMKDFFFCLMLADSERALDFGRFPVFTPMPFCYEQHVDEHEYGAMVQ